MKLDSSYKTLEKHFYEKPTIAVAQALLGCLLINQTEEGITSGFVVETEAYIGPNDKAAHSFNNRRTKRTEVMFGEAGHVYTYVMHTHCLLNVVTGEIGKPEAVLIRALEPYSDVDLMIKKRGNMNLKNLTSGPGKLTKALDVGMEAYGRPMFKSPLFLAEGFKPKEISSGKRIGIGNAGDAKEYPWRFWVTGNKFVSR